jgi:hypothetical protein
MMLVIPIFPQNPEQEALLWRSINGEAFLPWSLRRFSDASLAGMHVLVCTDNQIAVNHAMALQFDVRLLLADGPPAAPFLPPGSGSLLQHLADLPLSNEKQIVMLADYRTPLLSWTTMAKALAEFHESDASLLVSMAPVEDHPCQMGCYFRIIDFDIGCIQQGENLVGEQLRGLDDIRWPVYRAQKNFSRKIYTADSHQGIRKILLIPGDKGRDLYVRRDCLSNATIVRLWQVVDNAFSEPKTVDVVLPRADHLNTIVVSGCRHEFIGPIHTFESTQDIRNVISIFLQPCDHGEADFVEPLHVMEKLWDVDRDTGQRLNGSSGAAINGRQDFPDVCSLHSALAVGTARSMTMAVERLARSQMQGFALNRIQSLSVRTFLDLFKLRAYQHAQQFDHRNMKIDFADEHMLFAKTFHSNNQALPFRGSYPVSDISQRNKIFNKIKRLELNINDLSKKATQRYPQIETEFVALQNELEQIRQWILQEIFLLIQMQEYCQNREQTYALNGLSRIAVQLETNFVDLLLSHSETVSHHQDTFDANREEKGRLAFAVGRKLYETGDIDGALNAWLEALEVDPGNLVIHQNMASISDNTGTTKPVENISNDIDHLEIAAGGGCIAASDIESAELLNSIQSQYFLQEIGSGHVGELPFPRILTTDHKTSLFLSAFDTNRQFPSLSRFDLETMQLHTLREDRQYSGLWYDQACQVLYALRILLNGEKKHAVEVLDREGNILEIFPLPDTGSHQILFPSRLAGDESNGLYIMDLAKHQIVHLAKKSLKPTGIIRFPKLAKLTSLRFIGNKLFFVFKSLHMIAGYEPATGHMHWLPVKNISFPIDIVAEPESGNFFVIRTGHSFNSFTENDQHAIAKFDKEFCRIFQGWIGLSRISDAILLSHQGRTALFLADIIKGLRWFWLNPQ